MLTFRAYQTFLSSVRKSHTLLGKHKTGGDNMAQVYLTQAQERQAKAEKQLRIWIATQVTNQREIAKKTGLKYCTVNKRINEPETCTLEELWKILDALEVPPEERAKILL